MAKTLTERVIRLFSMLRLDKDLKTNNIKTMKPRRIVSTRRDLFTFIGNLTIKSAIDEVKGPTTQKNGGNGPTYRVQKDHKAFISSGYGTISRNYGIALNAPYIDYEKLFSYLGKFRAKSMYENTAEHIAMANNSMHASSATLVDFETMQIGARYVKYTLGWRDLNTVSMMPLQGMSSDEWERFKLWTISNPVMFRAMTTMS